MSELQQVLPALSPRQVQHLMHELREERKVRLEGKRRWAKWYPVGPNLITKIASALKRTL